MDEYDGEISDNIAKEISTDSLEGIAMDLSGDVLLDISDKAQALELVDSIGNVDVKTDALDYELPIRGNTSTKAFEAEFPLPDVNCKHAWIWGAILATNVTQKESDIPSSYEEYMKTKHKDYVSQILKERPDLKESFSKGVFREQGLNDFGMRGTCGPASAANAINYLQRGTGSPVLTENEVVAYGFYNNIFKDKKGGTEQVKLKDLIREVTSKKYHVEIEYAADLVIDDYVKRLDGNKVLIVDVRLRELCSLFHLGARLGKKFRLNRFPLFRKRGNHWITITEAEEDESDLLGFEIIDTSGTEKTYIGKEDFIWAHRNLHAASLLTIG